MTTPTIETLMAMIEVYKEVGGGVHRIALESALRDALDPGEPVAYGWVPMYREGEESARIFFKKPAGELGELCRPVYTRGTK